MNEQLAPDHWRARLTLPACFLQIVDDHCAPFEKQWKYSANCYLPHSSKLGALMVAYYEHGDDQKRFWVKPNTFSWLTSWNPVLNRSEFVEAQWKGWLFKFKFWISKQRLFNTFPIGNWSAFLNPSRVEFRRWSSFQQGGPLRWLINGELCN